MVGRERREPVHGEVMGPDDEDGQVDRQDPESQEEERVRVVGEGMGGRRLRFFDDAQRPRAGCDLHDAGDEVGELVGD